MGGSRYAACILRTSALSAAVHCSHHESFGRISQFVHPVTGMGSVAVKHEDGGSGTGPAVGKDELGMDSGAVDPGEIEVFTPGK